MRRVIKLSLHDSALGFIRELDALFDQSPIAMVFNDRELRARRTNAAFRRLTGLPDEAITGGLQRSTAAREPHPAGGFVTHPAGVAAQHRVLVPEHEQLSILGQIPAEHEGSEAEYPANQQVDDLEQHSASQPSSRRGCWR
jgi:PAS domain-containing protein